jgi:hypothetical protein
MFIIIFDLDRTCCKLTKYFQFVVHKLEGRNQRLELFFTSLTIFLISDAVLAIYQVYQTLIHAPTLFGLVSYLAATLANKVFQTVIRNEVLNVHS